MGRGAGRWEGMGWDVTVGGVPGPGKRGRHWLRLDVDAANVGKGTAHLRLRLFVDFGVFVAAAARPGGGGLGGDRAGEST